MDKEVKEIIERKAHEAEIEVRELIKQKIHVTEGLTARREVLGKVKDSLESDVPNSLENIIPGIEVVLAHSNSEDEIIRNTNVFI